MMEQNAMTPDGYTLMPVYIGPHMVYSRPIEWNAEDVDGFGNDKEGKPVKAVRWHSTCPECAQLIDFDNSKIFTDGKDLFVACEECGTGSTSEKTALSSAKVEEKDDVFEDEEDLHDSWLPMSKTTTSMFVDPISAGKIMIDVNLEMLDLLK